MNRLHTNPRLADSDGDGLSDGREVGQTHTNPLRRDSDGDGVEDGADLCPLVPGERTRSGCPAPPHPGTITDFPEIHFLQNSDRFDFTQPETATNLANVLAYMQQCADLSVIIEGHASREGNEEHNQELSELRARRVKEWLVAQGVDSNRIEATLGFGSSKPAVPEPAPNSAAARRLAPEKLESIRRRNRRISLRVVRGCDER